MFGPCFVMHYLVSCLVFTIIFTRKREPVALFFLVVPMSCDCLCYMAYPLVSHNDSLCFRPCV